MWPFPSRSSRANVIAPHPSGLPDFKEYVESKAKLKVWLPQVLVDRINWLSKHEEASRPDVIRALLFQHIYGHIAFLALMDFKKERDFPKSWQGITSTTDDHPRVDALLHSQPSDIIRSRARSTSIDLEMLGKSDEDITLTLPQRLKDDLSTVAQLHRLTPSSYIRKMLVQMLMGEEAHAQWQREIGKISQDVEKLEQD